MMARGVVVIGRLRWGRRLRHQLRRCYGDGNCTALALHQTTFHRQATLWSQELRHLTPHFMHTQSVCMKLAPSGADLKGAPLAGPRLTRQAFSDPFKENFIHAADVP